MKEKILAFLKRYSFVLTGGGIGLLFGILVLIIGLFRTIFLFICSLIGVFFASPLWKKSALYKRIKEIFDFRDDL